MARLTNRLTGVVVNVSDDAAKRLAPAGYEAEAKPEPKKTARKSEK